MKSPFRLAVAAVGGLALLANCGRPASAGDMYAATGFNASPYTSILNGIPGANGEQQSSAADFFSAVSTTGTVGADISSLGATFKSYCVDLFQADVQKVVDLANVSTTVATTNTDGSGFHRNLGAAGWVVDNYGVTLGVINTDAAWKNLEALAGVNPANVTYLEQVAVTQTAVWDKAYGATSASIAGSEGGSTNVDANSLLTQLLALAGGNIAPVGFIDYPVPAIPGAFNNQDQLTDARHVPPFVVVPEPASVALLGLGVLGVVGYGWKRRKRI